MIDEILIKKFNAGSGVVFRKIYGMYYLPLKSYAFSYIKDYGIADDFVQDAFLILWEKRAFFSSIPALKSFLYKTVKNSCIDYCRHLNVQLRNSHNIIGEIKEDSFDKFIIEEEVHALVYQAIKSLSPQSRRMIVMTMEGVSNHDIADSLNVSVNTVKTVKLRAYRVLRESLKGLQWSWLWIIFNS